MLTLTESVYRFLQVDKLQCNNCGKQLSVFRGYHKLAMWPQYAFFTWRWLKQLWFGDNMVLRFCFADKNRDCFNEFVAKGRLGEIRKK